MLHASVQRAHSSYIHGTGLIATDSIQMGEIIWRRDAQMQTFSLHEIQTWTQTEQDTFFWFAFQCDAETFIYTLDDDGYMNHSCNPNTWWQDDETLIARRDIAAGEEVTYDYASTEISVPYRMDCRCKSPNCRGVVTHEDYLNPNWQAFYGAHIPQFVQKAIAHAAE